MRPEIRVSSCLPQSALQNTSEIAQSPSQISPSSSQIASAAPSFPVEHAIETPCLRIATHRRLTSGELASELPGAPHPSLEPPCESGRILCMLFPRLHTACWCWFPLCSNVHCMHARAADNEGTTSILHIYAAMCLLARSTIRIRTTW